MVAVSAGRVVGFVRGIALTWLMTPASFGALNVGMTVANVLMPLVGLGLSQGMMRYAPEHEARGTLQGFVRSATRVAMIVAGVVSLAVFLMAGRIALFLPIAESQSIVMIRVVAGCAFSLTVFHIVSDLLKGLRMFRAVAVMDVASVVGYSLLAIATAWFWTDNAAIVLTGYGVSSLILAIWFAGGLRKAIRARGEVRHRPARPDARLWRFSLWMMGTMLAWQTLQQCGLWYLSWMDGTESAGAFYAARLFAQLVLWGGLALSSALSAHVMRAWEADGSADALVRLEAGTRVGCLAILAGGVVLSMTGPWLLRVFRSEYSVDPQTFDTLVASFCALATFGFVQIRFSVEEQSHRSFWTCAGGLLVASLVAVVLSRLSGDDLIEQAAWITFAGGMSAVVFAIVLLTFHGSSPSPASVAVMLSIPAIAIDSRLALVLLLLWLALFFGSRRFVTGPERRILSEWFTRR